MGIQVLPLDCKFTIKFQFDPTEEYLVTSLDPTRAVDALGHELTSVTLNTFPGNIFGEVNASVAFEPLPAEFFLNWIKGGACAAKNSLDSHPSKLHFAFAISITVGFKGNIYTNDNIILGQGANGDLMPVFNWWIGGPDMRYPSKQYDPPKAVLMVPMYNKEGDYHLDFPLFLGSNDYTFRLENARY